MEPLVFDDGDIELVFPKTTHRVHKATLRAKIPFFEDLFDLGQPDVSNLEIPSIQLPDEEEAFGLFLRSVYDYDLASYFPSLSRRNTRLLSQLLDIADKYALSDPHRLVLPFLSRDWPESLAGWDALEQSIEPIFTAIREARTGSNDVSEFQTLDDRLPDPAEAIALAVRHRNHLGLDLGLGSNLLVAQPYPKFLHSAFYHLSRLPPYADPEEEPLLITEDDHDDGIRTARRSLLGRQDFQLLLSGIDALRSQAASIAFKTFPNEARIKSKGLEADAMLRWWSKVGATRLLGEDYQRDILRSLHVLDVALGRPSKDGATAELKMYRAGDRCADVEQAISQAWERVIDDETTALYNGTRQEYRKQLSSWLGEQRVIMWDSLPQYFNLARFYDTRLG